mgnify:CR=1 FL=1
MNKRTLAAGILILASLSYVKAQNTPAAADTAWKLGGNFSLQFNQAAYSNWQAGGVNSIAGNGLLNIYANYDDGGLWTWNNALTLGYGLALQDTLFNKTDDRIELESRVDRSISKNWAASGFLNFRTQFAPGFKNPGDTDPDSIISNFMAPGYLLTGIGFTYKPRENFSVFLSPATNKMTFVLSERLSNQPGGAFGVDSGEAFRYELGGYINLNYKQKLMKNVELTARLDLYSNYLEDPTLIDVNSEVIVFMKVNKYITANLSLNVVYDHDVKFDLDNNPDTPGVPRTQFREILGIGFSYNFGSETE